LIAASFGPGSFTGIRIGAAIARGLSKSLECEIAAFSIFEAMIQSVSDYTGDELDKSAACVRTGRGKIIAFIPFGKSQICEQRFHVGENGLIENSQNPEMTNRADFAERLNFDDFDKIILQKSLWRQLNASNLIDTSRRRKIVDAGFNLAESVGKTAIKGALKFGGRIKHISPPITPIYVRNYRRQ
jgi:hypothetical protein